MCRPAASAEGVLRRVASWPLMGLVSPGIGKGMYWCIGRGRRVCGLSKLLVGRNWIREGVLISLSFVGGIVDFVFRVVC